MSHENTDRNEARPQHDQSSLGAAATGSAAHVSKVAPGESYPVIGRSPRCASELRPQTAEIQGQDHEVTVWDLPAELAGNEGLHELECETCGVIGAIQDPELAQKIATLHTDFFGPLRSVLGRSPR